MAENDRPTFEAIRAWWRRTRADETCPLTKADWEELDAAIRRDERALMAATPEPFEEKVERIMEDEGADTAMWAYGVGVHRVCVPTVQDSIRLRKEIVRAVLRAAGVGG